MGCSYTFRPLKEADEVAESAARAFARASLYERVWLHGALEIPLLRARAEPLVAFHQERVIGLGAVLSGVFPFRVVAIDGSLPGVASELFARFEPPFVCRVPARLAREIEHAGGRAIRTERQLVRFDPVVSRPAPDSQIERLTDSAELARFCGPSFAPLALELAPFFGIRDAFGELAAVAGGRLVTERIALIGQLETREDHRRQGFARALAAAIACSLETRERRVVAHVNPSAHGAEHLLTSLGFRGAHDECIFAR